MDVFVPGCPPLGGPDLLGAQRAAGRAGPPNPAREIRIKLCHGKRSSSTRSPASKATPRSRSSSTSRATCEDAHFHVTQFRGFEKFCEGRPFYEMPSLMARICGICPVSHLIASAKACDAHPGGAHSRQRRAPAPHPEPGADRAVARAQLLPPLLAGPAAGHGCRPGQAQHLRRGGSHTRRWPATASACASSASRSSNGWAASGFIRPGSCPAASASR